LTVPYEKLKYNKKIEQYAKQVFEYAVSSNIIDRNPMQSVTTPKKNYTSNTPSYYTREELIEFLEAAKNEPLKKYAYLRLLAYTGMRRAEGFALTWSDINFKDKTITVSKAVTFDEDGILVLGPTKTSNTRELYIDDTTVNILKEWQTTQKDLLGKLKKNQLVFPNSLNEIAYPSKAYDWCNQVVKKYNLKYINPHGLRRTHATLYHASGVDDYEIKKRLGHAFNDVTSKYYIMENDETKYKAFQKFINYMNY
jgi:integrase